MQIRISNPRKRISGNCPKLCMLRIPQPCFYASSGNESLFQKIFERKLYNVIFTSRKYHFELVTVARQFNQHFSVPILLKSILNFVTVVGQFYYWSEYVLFDDKRWTYKNGLYSLVFFVLVSGTEVLLVATCSLTKEEVRIHKFQNHEFYQCRSLS